LTDLPIVLAHYEQLREYLGGDSSPSNWIKEQIIGDGSNTASCFLIVPSENLVVFLLEISALLLQSFKIDARPWLFSNADGGRCNIRFFILIM
jgi:hypothetical protein